MKVLLVKSHGNPSSGSRMDTFGETDGQSDGHDVADRRLHDYVNAPKNCTLCYILQSQEF